MPRSFTVNLPPESRTVYPDANGRAEIAYTVTNGEPVSVRGRIHAVPGAAILPAWLDVLGDAERDFRPGETQQFAIRISIPAGTQAGSFGFRLDAVNVANPQEDFTEGESIAVVWKPAPAEASSHRPWWIAGIAAIFLGISIWKFWPEPKVVPDKVAPETSAGVPVPDVNGLSELKAAERVGEAGLRVGEDHDWRYLLDGRDRVVIGTNPRKDTPVAKGTEIQFIVEVRGELVPSVIRMTQAEAEEALDTKGFEVDAKYGRVEDDTPAGIVLAQEPEADDANVVAVGSTVRIVVQAAPEPIQVPTQLKGEDFRTVIGVLRGTYLSCNWIPVAATRANELPGTVLELSPGEGQLVPPGTELDVKVVGVKVPSPDGKSLKEYCDQLRDLGLRSSVNASEDEFLWTPHPASGELLLPGDTVRFKSRFTRLDVEPRSYPGRGLPPR